MQAAPYPSTEDVPVTFQVGMVASDGVILASDTRITYTQSARTKSTTEKIICEKEPQIAYCWSGDEMLGNVASGSGSVSISTGMVLGCQS